MRGRLFLATAAAIATIASAVSLSRGQAVASDQSVSGQPRELVTIRRLTEEQYRNSIADIFGRDIKLLGRFEPDLRREGLMAAGASLATVSPAGLGQYAQIGRGVAQQVTDEDHRGVLIPCEPVDPRTADAACARAFVARTGALLFRRPLEEAETATYVATAGDAAQRLGDFHKGLALSLEAMLVSPKFLFITEQYRQSAGSMTLSAQSRAARLAAFFWASGPDAALLDAAARGELETAEGIARQVDRLIASSRYERGVRAFFSDLLGFHGFDAMAKDASIYPKFSLRVAADSREQTLRIIVDQLVTRNGDFRDLFTTRRSFMTRPLAAIYRVPMSVRSGWEAYEFPEGDPRGGLMQQISFLMLHSHPGRSSPTLRGMAVRNLLLCQEVPAPPANVDFALVQDTDNPAFRTARARLAAHNDEPMCAACHRLMDPIGLAMENYDSSGEWRATENGAPIDASGELDGVKFTDAAGLAQAMRGNEQAAACIVQRTLSYGLGQPLNAEQEAFAEKAGEAFAREGYRFPALMRRIATDPSFFSAPASSPREIALIQRSRK